MSVLNTVTDPPSPTSGAGAYSGLLNMNFFDMPGFAQNPVTRTDQYRWLVGDSVPYTNGLNVKIENYGNLGGGNTSPVCNGCCRQWRELSGTQVGSQG